MYSVHLQCTQWIPCSVHGLRIDRWIHIDRRYTHRSLDCALHLPLYTYDRDTCVYLLCSVTCSDNNCIVNVCNNTLLHAFDYVGRYMYMTNLNVIYIFTIRIYYLNHFVGLLILCMPNSCRSCCLDSVCRSLYHDALPSTIYVFHVPCIACATCQSHVTDSRNVNNRCSTRMGNEMIDTKVWHYMLSSYFLTLSRFTMYYTLIITMWNILQHFLTKNLIELLTIKMLEIYETYIYVDIVLAKPHLNTI